jgi:hypothetical protein
MAGWRLFDTAQQRIIHKYSNVFQGENLDEIESVTDTNRGSNRPPATEISRRLPRISFYSYFDQFRISVWMASVNYHAGLS